MTQSPGLRFAATLGISGVQSQPRRGCASLITTSPRVAAKRQPWAVGRNRFGVKAYQRYRLSLVLPAGLGEGLLAVALEGEVDERFKQSPKRES
jgi:hypothetical protein